MAEGLLGGWMGGEEEETEREAAAEAIAGAEAYATTLAAEQAKHDPGVARAAQAFLEEQTRLLAVQRQDILEQSALRMSQLRMRHAGQRLRLAMQFVTAAIFAAVGFVVIVMVRDAVTSRSVVVNAFKAPSALAGRGVTGDVVAAGVLDTLRKLQDATRSADKGLEARGAWDSDVRIEVPETGVSIGEINRLLHERFGHDLHIDGDLMQTEQGGLALTVRGQDVPASTFTGGPGDLGKLTTRAAEYVYGRSQPVRYGKYLVDNGRDADALVFFPGAFARAESDDVRSALAREWGDAFLDLNRAAEAAGKFRLAMQLGPQPNWVAWADLIAAVALAEGEEAGWRESRAMLQAADAAPADKQPELRLLTNPATLTYDLPLLTKVLLADASFNGGAGTITYSDQPAIADVYGLRHDPANADLHMAASDPHDPLTKAEAQLLKAYAALDRGNPAAAIAPMEGFWAAWRANPSMPATYPDSPCILGLAYGMGGRLADAEALFRQMGALSRCYAYHGDVLVHAGDFAGASSVWAEGIRLAPDLPLVYLHRGMFEADRGDFKAAEADLSTAAARAPHFADPWKAWGDLLAREGHWSEAMVKYDEALKYAPAWAELRDARSVAAKNQRQ